MRRNVHRNPDLAQQISRSPRAIKTIQALDTAIATLTQTQPEPEYQVSEYETKSRRWKRTPRFHPVPITELLEYKVQNKHHRNKILGDKVAKVFQQNTNLSDTINEENRLYLSKLISEIK
jgi:hypothetical protein